MASQQREILLRPRPLLQRLSYAGLELAWGYPWLALLTRSFEPPAARWGPVPFLAVMILGWWASAFVERRALAAVQERLLLVAAAFALCLAVFGLSGAGLAGGLYFWWRGLLLAQAGLGHESASFRFRWGVLALFWLLLVGLLFGPLQAVGPVLAVFFSGLLAVGLGRMESGGAPGVSPAAALRWLAVLGLSSLAVLAAAGGGLLFLRSRLFQLLWAPVAGVLERVLWGVLLLFAYLISPALNFMIDFVRGLGLERPRGQPLEALEQLRREMESLAGQPMRGEWLIELLQWTVIALVVLLVAAALFLSISREREGRRSEDEGQRIPLVARSPGLRDLLRRGLERLRDRGQERLRGREGDGASAVRRIYRELLRQAEARGEVRPPSATPLEFLPRLEQAFPAHELELSVLTRAYQLARYAEREPTAEELEDLFRAG